jgi:hypothetical protein
MNARIMDEGHLLQCIEQRIARLGAAKVGKLKTNDNK